MSAIEELLGKLPGKPTLRQEFVQVRWLSDLQVARVVHVIRGARWICYLGAPLILLVSLLEFGPSRQQQFRAAHQPGPQLGWAVGDLAMLGFAAILAMVMLYIGRHLPHGAFFPSCRACGSVAETARALRDGRYLCSRCGRKLPMEEVQPAFRRSFRSL